MHKDDVILHNDDVVLQAIEADASRDAMADDIETAVANAIADVHKDERPLEYLQSMFTSATSVDIDTYTPMDD